LPSWGFDGDKCIIIKYILQYTTKVQKLFDTAKPFCKKTFNYFFKGLKCQTSESGFNDRSYFYQQFLLYSGVSVSDFKNGILKKTNS